jgi:hypothetical protein
MNPGQEHRLAAADALNSSSSAWRACKSSGLPRSGVSPRDELGSGLTPRRRREPRASAGTSGHKSRARCATAGT